MTKKVYTLLPMHNLREIMRSLKLRTYSNYHLLLIEDASTDGTEQMIREKIDTLTVLKGNESWWWAGSLQQGNDWLKIRKLFSTEVS